MSLQPRKQLEPVWKRPHPLPPQWVITSSFLGEYPPLFLMEEVSCGGTSSRPSVWGHGAAGRCQIIYWNLIAQMFLLGSLTFLSICISIPDHTFSWRENICFLKVTKSPPSNSTVQEKKKKVILCEYHFSDFRCQMTLKSILGSHHVHQMRNSNIKTENKNKDRTQKAGICLPLFEQMFIGICFSHWRQAFCVIIQGHVHWSHQQHVISKFRYLPVISWELSSQWKGSGTGFSQKNIEI